jgi:hypothetical protein
MSADEGMNAPALAEGESGRATPECVFLMRRDSGVLESTGKGEEKKRKEINRTFTSQI